MSRYAFLLAAAILGGSAAHASLLFSGLVAGSGAGIGSSNLILTLQNTGVETGCVGWSGTVDVIGASACPGGLSPAIAGGDEKTGSSQTQTQTIAATGVTSAANLIVLLNANEPSGDALTIENLSLTIYDATNGTVLFNSGNLANNPVVLASTQQGQGTLGFGFVLDAAGALAAQPFWSNTNNRIGVAVKLSDAAGSNETLSVADSTGTSVTPEPSTFLLVGGLLIAAGLTRYRSTR